jgi:hypothetical protein
MTFKRKRVKVRQGWIRSGSMPVSSRYHIDVPIRGVDGEIHWAFEYDHDSRREPSGVMRPGCRVGN